MNKSKKFQIWVFDTTYLTSSTIRKKLSLVLKQAIIQVECCMLSRISYFLAYLTLRKKMKPSTVGMKFQGENTKNVVLGEEEEEW